MGSLGLKALSEFDQFNPVRNLWRNVLIVSIEDAIKVANAIRRFPDFYGSRRFHELDYVMLPNSDFRAVCEYAELDHNMLRNKIISIIERIKDGEGHMPEMQRKWLHMGQKGTKVTGKRRSHSSAVYYV